MITDKDRIETLELVVKRLAELINSVNESVVSLNKLVNDIVREL